MACFHPDSIAIYEERRAQFKLRRDFLVPALREIGFQVPVMPDGAFYVYADISQVAHQASGDSAAFCLDVLAKTGVAIVPGADFGFAAPERHVRLSYATTLSRIEEAVARLARLLGR
jgi:aspartate/methionine/tyrosine aminotransferase